MNLINACYSLGELKIHSDEFDAALELIQKGLLLSEEIESNLNLKKGHELLANLFKKEGMSSLAFNEINLRDQYDAKIKNEQRLGRIVDIKSQYENEKNKQFIAEIEKKQDSTRKLHYLATILVLIIGGLSFTSVIVFIYHSKLKGKKNEAFVKLEKLKADFYRNITQEFKTPVNIIQGLIERLRGNLEKGDSARNHYDLDIISRQSDNLLFLINELISISKIQTDKTKVEYQHGNIIYYLRYLYNCFQNLADEKKINYIFDSSYPELFMDYSQQDMHLIINNLLSNSFNRCKENDKILFFVRETADKHCIIEISDTGEEIPADDIPHIFELYYQGSAENLKNTGAGIGLNITKQLVEKLNGTIYAKSEPNVKTSFVVTLPITNRFLVKAEVPGEPLNAETQTSQRIKAEVSDDTVSKTDASKSLILISEDNKDLIYYISSILKDKYNIITTTNGVEAFEVVQSHLPDLIISDLVMPGKDGRQLCRDIKQSELASHIPFIMLTAKTDLQDRIDSFNVGVDAYLTKPFHEEELLAIVSQLLKNRSILKEKYKDIIFRDVNSMEQKNDKNFEFLQKVSVIVLREIKNPDFFPQGLASELAVSTSQLNRKLNSISGLSCMNFVNQVRLNRAKKLLITSMKPIGDIAMECGYSDFAHFSRSFKKEFGITPSQYQRVSQLKK